MLYSVSVGAERVDARHRAIHRAGRPVKCDTCVDVSPIPETLCGGKSGTDPRPNQALRHMPSYPATCLLLYSLGAFSLQSSHSSSSRTLLESCHVPLGTGTLRQSVQAGEGGTQTQSTSYS